MALLPVTCIRGDLNRVRLQRECLSLTVKRLFRRALFVLLIPATVLFVFNRDQLRSAIMSLRWCEILLERRQMEGGWINARRRHRTVIQVVQITLLER